MEGEIRGGSGRSVYGGSSIEMIVCNGSVQ